MTGYASCCKNAGSTRRPTRAASCRRWPAIRQNYSNKLNNWKRSAHGAFFIWRFSTSTKTRVVLGTRAEKYSLFVFSERTRLGDYLRNKNLFDPPMCATHPTPVPLLSIPSSAHILVPRYAGGWRKLPTYQRLHVKIRMAGRLTASRLVDMTGGRSRGCVR